MSPAYVADSDRSRERVAKINLSQHISLKPAGAGNFPEVASAGDVRAHHWFNKRTLAMRIIGVV
jgi:hypothetical protein